MILVKRDSGGPDKRRGRRLPSPLQSYSFWKLLKEPEALSNSNSKAQGPRKTERAEAAHSPDQAACGQPTAGAAEGKSGQVHPSVIGRLGD